MKAHCIVKLMPGVPLVNAPHWMDLIHDKSIGRSDLHPDVDAVLKQYKLPVWVCREHRSASSEWNDIELACGLDRLYRLVLQKDQHIPSGVIGDLNNLPVVEFAYSGRVAHSGIPDAQGQAASMERVRASRETIHLDESHAILRGSSEITIAVLDTGLFLEHPELDPRLILPGYDFVNILDGAGRFIGDYLQMDEIVEDEVGHGTHVTGIIAAQGNNMPTGVAPACKILPVRVLGTILKGEEKIGAGMEDNINVAIKWAVDQGADVINMSLGSRSVHGRLPYRAVIEYAHKKGVTVVAATGNDGQRQLYYPSALPGVIGVGASDRFGNAALFSTYGEQVDLLAPGEDIYSTYLNGGYAFYSGTSQSAPFVTGAAALLKSYAWEFEREQLQDRIIKRILFSTAHRSNQSAQPLKSGRGQLDVLAALQKLGIELMLHYEKKPAPRRS